MRYLPIEKLELGMAIGQEIFDGTGSTIYEKHTLITDKSMEELNTLGFPGIYIDDEFTRGIEIQQIISPEIKRESLKAIHDVFLTGNDSGDSEEQVIQKTVEEVVDELLTNGDVMLNMMDIKSYDDYIYFHSINVTMISTMIGCKLGLEKPQLRDLAASALLHDVGKRFVEGEVLSKTKVLTEEERSQLAQHPKLGYEFLMEHFDFHPEVAMGVLEHHEWFNGEGYPLRRSGEQIPLFGRILKVADCYDAMVSKRPYHNQILPSDAVEYIMAMAGTEFDPKLVSLFLDCIAVYPVGCEVVLSNGEHAIVMKNYRGFVLRPRLMLVGDAKTVDLKDDVDARCLTIVALVV